MQTGTPGPEEKQSTKVDHYDASYGHFASKIFEDIRRETFGEDIGQNGWLTADEQSGFIEWLSLTPASHLLDIACGSGGPTLRIAQRAKCRVHGIDQHEQGVATARKLAQERNLADRARFDVMDASRPLSFQDGSFSALMCVDAINHLPERASVLADWARLLEPGGRVLFTDPIVVTGPLTNREIAIRSSIGFFLFVPPGLDERLIEQAGLRTLRQEDVTENMASVASRWHAARAARETELRRLEGDQTYEGQQEFFHVAATIAAQRRLSRSAFLAEKP